MSANPADLSAGLPTRTLRFLTVSSDDIHADELIISAGDATEDRGQLPVWGQIASAEPSRVWWITHTDQESITLQRNGESRVVSLNDEGALEDLLDASRLMLDISGLQHQAWAPLLKCAFRLKVKTRVLYAEPAAYKFHSSPASATMFDLSVKFNGLSPLPGFAKLSGPSDESKSLFIALLGFEGNRPEYLAFQLDPTPRVIPIVGVPGFRLDFPTYTVTCNRTFLEEHRSHSEIRFARASCPFEVLQALRDLSTDYPGHYMYLAPVGTKPHALGAVLFAIINPESTEIMFDHPIRKVGRTKGVGTIHIYDFGEFDAL